VIASRMQDLATFLESQGRWLQMERDAEMQQAKEEELAGRKEFIRKLRVRDMASTIGGKYTICLENTKENEPFPATSIGVGDVVSLRSTKVVEEAARSAGKSASSATGPAEEVESIQGVVSRMTDLVIHIVADESISDLPEPLRLDKLFNEATFVKLSACRARLETCHADHPAFSLREIAFGREPLVPWSEVELSRNYSPATQVPASFFNRHLDPSQQEAVSRALARPDFALIHGPPGTGKTTALIEFICQATARGQKLLVTAPSNVAVDNIVERLLRVAPSLKLCRLGHPARFSEAVQSVSLDVLISQGDNAALVQDIHQEMDTLLQAGKKKRLSYAENKQRWRDWRALKKEARERERAAEVALLGSVQVMLSTLVTAASHRLKGLIFDCVVIDEVAQSLEIACWIPLLNGKKAVLAGDDLQLGPTILSEKAGAQGFSRTLFARLRSHYGDECCTLLNVQYRMHDTICQWSSTAMYQGKLTSDETVAAHTLESCPSRCLHPKHAASANVIEGGREGEGVEDESWLQMVMVAIDCAGMNMEESETESASRRNDGEVQIVCRVVERLVQAGIPCCDIGIITPYNGQVDALRGALWVREDHPVGSDGTGSVAPSGGSVSGGGGGKKKDKDKGSRGGGKGKGKGSSKDRGGKHGNETETKHASTCVRSQWRDVEIGSVDGFQGREKEVIIISFVRCNDQGEVGFLTDDRRTNVAVTRARRQVVLIGDSDTLERHKFLKKLWVWAEEHGEYHLASDYM
jgi:hypothetical protein